MSLNYVYSHFLLPLLLLIPLSHLLLILLSQPLFLVTFPLFNWGLFIYPSPDFSLSSSFSEGNTALHFPAFSFLISIFSVTLFSFSSFIFWFSFLFTLLFSPFSSCSSSRYFYSFFVLLVLRFSSTHRALSIKLLFPKRTPLEILFCYLLLLFLFWRADC